MNLTRLVELSLVYTIKSHLSIRKTNETPTTDNYINYRLKYNDILDDVEVMVNGLVPTIPYSVNYRDGIVTFNTALAPTDSVKVSYNYSRINIYDEGKNPYTDDTFKYPAVSIYEAEMEANEGIELGSGKKEKNSIWVFDVWTERGGERHDISDSIFELFEENNIAILDYNIAFPIDQDGNKNPTFDMGKQVVGYLSCDSINKTNGGSLGIGDKPKYMSEIVVELSYI